MGGEACVGGGLHGFLVCTVCTRVLLIACICKKLWLVAVSPQTEGGGVVAWVRLPTFPETWKSSRNVSATVK